jgi:single-stranded DNA-specific DHH superfamily exonuclease
VLSKGIAPLLFASHADYPGGVLGLVAGRLVEEFYHPAVVIRVGEEISHGSSRSTPDFNINQASASAPSCCRTLAATPGRPVLRCRPGTCRCWKRGWA